MTNVVVYVYLFDVELRKSRLGGSFAAEPNSTIWRRLFEPFDKTQDRLRELAGSEFGFVAKFP